MRQGENGRKVCAMLSTQHTADAHNLGLRTVKFNGNNWQQRNRYVSFGATGCHSPASVFEPHNSQLTAVKLELQLFTDD
jgi:hypothetical protein